MENMEAYIKRLKLILGVFAMSVVITACAGETPKTAEESNTTSETMSNEDTTGEGADGEASAVLQEPQYGGNMVLAESADPQNINPLYIDADVLYFGTRSANQKLR